MEKFALVTEIGGILKKTYTRKEIECYKKYYEELGIKNLKIIEITIDTLED